MTSIENSALATAWILLLSAVMPAASHAQETGPSALSETYGSWVVSCQSRGTDVEGETARQCQMSQNLTQQRSGQRILFVGITRNPEDGAATMSVVAPFGLDLSQGFALEVEETAVLEAPFETCLPAGCIVNSPITMDQISRLAAQDIGTARMVSNGQTPDNPLRIQFQMDGFLGAWNRLIDLSGG